MTCLKNISIIALLILLAFCFTGCQSDGDDNPKSDNNNDDNDLSSISTASTDDDIDTSVDPIPYQGVFLLPNYHYADSNNELLSLLTEIRTAGPTTVIWQWTLHYDRVCYPSQNFDEIPGMVSDDLIEGLLLAADLQEMDVYLGLSAARRPAEYYSDPVAPETQRTQALITELAQRYGSHKSFKGFYIPFEFTHAPNDVWLPLLSQITYTAHTALPGCAVLMSNQYHGPAQHHFMTYILQNWLTPGMNIDTIDDAAERSGWAKNSVAAFAQAGIDVMLLKTMMGNYKNTYEDAYQNFEAINKEVDTQKAPLQIWAQADLYDALNTTGAMRRVLGPASTHGIEQQHVLAHNWHMPVVGFSWDNYVNTNGQVVPPQSGTDPKLVEKARIIEEHLRSRGMRDGQVMPIIDGQKPFDLFANRWQEDACWLTGLYCAAASFQCATTGEDQACEYARQLGRQLHKLANVTPMPGEVVRNYVRYLYAQPEPVSPGSSNNRRWHKHPTKEVYWIGDISVDQLSGYFYGLTTFYDLVADKDERTVIEQDMENIMGKILDNQLRAYEYTGKNTTHGNLRAAPELALTFLLMAYHITQDEKYLSAFEQLMENEGMAWQLALFHFVMHGLHRYSGQHFLDSSLRYLYEYLPDDPDKFHQLIWGLEYVYQSSFTWGNAMCDFTHQAHHPDSAGAARALHDHYMYNPYYLDNGVWGNEVNQNFGDAYHPMEYRPFDEWDWTQSPTGKMPRNGANHRYPGVSFLVTYWEGRWHGWIL